MSDQLSSTFAALADPTRRAILARLALGEASVTELAEPFHMSMPAISKHLKVLERAGLIATDIDAQRRPRRLQAQPMKQAAGWIEQYRAHWERNFQRLDTCLVEMKKKEKQRARKK
jgi:DNA-binding transcriptional ArsR family regulator